MKPARIQFTTMKDMNRFTAFQRLSSLTLLGLVTSPLMAQTLMAQTFIREVLTEQYYCDGVSAGDIDSDGSLDIVAGPFWYRGPGFREAHAFYPPVALPREPSPSNSMFSFVHDFNGDSHPDILVLGRVHKHQAIWYENPGPQTFAKHRAQNRVIPSDWKRHFAFQRVRGESPALIDIDADGQVELICHWEGRWGWIEPNAADPYAPWLFHPVGDNEGWPQFYHGQGVGDVNQDGRLDLIINDGWYEQPVNGGSSQRWTFHRHRFSQQRGGAQMFAVDLDEDKDADIVSAVDAHGWGLAWYEHRASQSGVRFAERLIMGDRSMESKYGAAFTQPHALAMADIDGDGRLDIVTGKRRWAHGPKGDIEPMAEPVVYWFRSRLDDTGTPRFEPHRIDAESGVGVQILATDVDGDNRVDVVTASKLGTFLFRQKPVITKHD